MLFVPHTTFLWLTYDHFSYGYGGYGLKPTGSIPLQGHWTTWNYTAVDTLDNNLQPKVSGTDKEMLQSPDFKWTIRKCRL